MKFVKETVDPNPGELDRYVAGDHMETDNVHIRPNGELSAMDILARHLFVGFVKARYFMVRAVHTSRKWHMRSLMALLRTRHLCSKRSKEDSTNHSAVAHVVAKVH